MTSKPVRLPEIPMWSVPAASGLGLCALEDDPDIFTSLNAEDEVAAAEVCRKCPIQWECLKDTERASQELKGYRRAHRISGVYGGVVFVEGVKHPPGRRVRREGTQDDSVAELLEEMFPERYEAS